jgi:hypothetical protein
MALIVPRQVIERTAEVVGLDPNMVLDRIDRLLAWTRALLHNPAGVALDRG